MENKTAKMDEWAGNESRFLGRVKREKDNERRDHRRRF